MCRGRGPIPKTHGNAAFPVPLTSTRAILVSSADMKGNSLFLYFPVPADQDFLLFLGGLCLLGFPVEEGAAHGLGMERLLQSPFAKGFQGQSCELDLTKQGWREKYTPLVCVLAPKSLG